MKRRRRRKLTQQEFSMMCTCLDICEDDYASFRRSQYSRNRLTIACDNSERHRCAESLIQLGYAKILEWGFNRQWFIIQITQSGRSALIPRFRYSLYKRMMDWSEREDFCRSRMSFAEFLRRRVYSDY